jgi:DNA-binding CsgD family transcriptional regulator
MRGARDEQELRALFAAALTKLDIGTFNYGAGQLVPGEGPTLERYWTNMDPAWLERYVARRYQRLDRLVVAGLIRVTPFFFDDVFCVPPQLEEQKEMETMFPYKRGVVVPIHSPVGRFGMVSAASRLSVEEWEDTKYSCMANVSLVALSAHQRSEELSAQRQSSTIRLSERERETLRWAAYGKTSEDIALIMGISERTVRKHVGSAMLKLDVTSRVQAVARAIAAGLVHI